MNAKLLYIATVALSLASTLALADETDRPATRADVVAQLHQAAADGTLRKTDYDYDKHDFAGAPKTRTQIVSELQVARATPALPGPLADRTYNPFGRAATLPMTATRAGVKADLQDAIANGTLQRTDYDDDQAVVARRTAAHEAGKPLFARIRSAFSRHNG
jgi:hypothetical protein